MHALKIETASIQKYIFSSNRLKVNLGGSYIIEHLLFKELLKKVCENEFNQDAGEQVDNWFQEDIDYEKLKGSEEFRIGYIGGGNAILFAQEKENLEDLEVAFKKEVLKAFPGLEVYSDITDKTYDLDGMNKTDYQKMNRHLTEIVKEKRSARPFINQTFNHGFYKHCRISGGPAMEEWRDGDDLKLLSDIVYSKMQYCWEQETGEAPANIQHKRDLLEKEYSDYSFPMKFDDLSKKEKKAYLAVVHIDGNNMGQQFIKAGKLEETQELSVAVRDIGRKALKQTIKEGILDKIEEKAIGDLQFTTGTIIDDSGEEKEIDYLPIRPLITGGDDITFVCEGTLGIPLAKLFLEKFHEAGKESKSEEFNDLHACAGVAIVKQKYPFSKAYRLSEELIREAKEVSRKQPGSYMSVMVAPYGTGSSLKELKKKYGRPELFAKAYQVKAANTSGMPLFCDIRNVIQEISGQKDKQGEGLIARNKLMELRKAILRGDNAIESIIQMIESRAKNKKELEKIREVLWKNREGNDHWKSLDFEAIEWMDFYNKAYVQQKQSEKEKEIETT